jgi:uncharacterized protein YbdZ (MbtH family)
VEARRSAAFETCDEYCNCLCNAEGILKYPRDGVELTGDRTIFVRPLKKDRSRYALLLQTGVKKRVSAQAWTIVLIRAQEFQGGRGQEVGRADMDYRQMRYKRGSLLATQLGKVQNFMANPFEDENEEYLVLVNAENQHSLWPAFRDIPTGWTHVGPRGERTECLKWIEANWTDMRPVSLVAKMTSGTPTARAAGQQH